MPAKMAQISPLGRRPGCQDYGRRPRRQAALSKRGNSAKIHPGLGFIWGIPAQAAPTRRFRCAGGHSAEKGRTPQEPEFNLAKRRLCNTVGRIVRGSNASCVVWRRRRKTV